MEEFVKNNLKFDNETLNELISDFNLCFDNSQKNFVDICVGIHRIWAYCRGNYFKAKNNEYYNSYKLLAKFGFDKKAVTRYNKCYEKFIVGKENNMFRIYAVVEGFTPSKLFELLSLSNDTILSLVTQGLVKPEMTVKQIREYIKSLKDGTDKAEKVVEDTTVVNEEDIPLAYDPKKEYEYSYFESKTKNQLLNIVWELQKAYQKLKNKGELKNEKQSKK